MAIIWLIVGIVGLNVSTLATYGYEALAISMFATLLIGACVEIISIQINEVLVKLEENDGSSAERD